MQTTGKDLAIDLGQDWPGMIAKAFEDIAKANVNVDGYCEAGEGILHVTTRTLRRRAARSRAPA